MRRRVRRPPRPHEIENAGRVADFGDYVVSWLGWRPPEPDLFHALGAQRVVEEQAGRKISPVHHPLTRAVNGRRHGPRAVGPRCMVSYLSFATCPRSCPFLLDRETGERRGCLAEADVFMRKLMKNLDESARKIQDPWLRRMLPGLAEAFAIERLFPDGVPQDGVAGGRDFRLHVAGDFADLVVARAIDASIGAWRRRGGGRAWGYTHRWPMLPRSVFRHISVMASVETEQERRAAQAQGYASFIVLPSFESNQRYVRDPDDPERRIVYCRHDEEGQRFRREGVERDPVTCVLCGLCLDDETLRRKHVDIGTSAHGTDAAAARRSIGEIQDAERVVRWLPVLR